jgi:hypothetical protein
MTTVYLLVFLVRRGSNNGLVLPPVWCSFCVLSTYIINTFFGFRVRIPGTVKRPDRLWGPPNLHFSGYLGCFTKVKLAGREAGHCLPPSAEVKNEWNYTFGFTVFLYGVERECFIVLPIPLPLDFRNIFFLLSGTAPRIRSVRYLGI